MRQEHLEILGWYAMMVGCASAMPEPEKQALVEWERSHVDHCNVATSDWPGWEKYIGKRPQQQEKTTIKKPIPYRLRWAVFKRDNFRCVDCGSQDDLAADHVLPECKRSEERRVGKEC